jgi:hypothetical protein
MNTKVEKLGKADRFSLLVLLGLPVPKTCPVASPPEVHSLTLVATSVNEWTGQNCRH